MAGRIDMAFTDIVLAALPFLPRNAAAATKPDFRRLSNAVRAAHASDDLPRWPAECLALLQACDDVLAGRQAALASGEIGRACSRSWPPRHAFAVMRCRADIGDAA